MRNHIIIGGAILAAIVIGILVFLFVNKNLSHCGRVRCGQEQEINNSTMVAVPFTKLVQGMQSSVPTRTNYLITSASELEKLWKMIDAKGNPPTVDFTKNAIVAVFAGQKPTAGYAIAVAAVQDTDVRTVAVVLSEPKSTCAEKRTAVTPYELVTFPKTSLPLAHKDHATTTPCPH